MNKIWQTTIWLKKGDSVTLYGATESELRAAVAAWLDGREALAFANKSTENGDAGRYCYFYSDGWLEMVVDRHGGRIVLPIGWHYKSDWNACEQPRYLGSSAALRLHLLENGLQIEPGPDYQKKRSTDYTDFAD
jgi:hypothetical protein